MTEIGRSLSALIYGPSKAGKSTLAITSPYPRLMLDVEASARFLPIQGKVWDPMREEPPVADGTWDTCVVPTLDYNTVLKVYQWLQLGRHQFKSLVIDSISELQVKLIDQVAGSDQLKMQHWGELLRSLGSLLRDLRDLTMHPTNPLEAVVLTSMQREGQDGRFKPYLQGQIQVVAPYLFDILGYLRIEQYPNPDPSQPPYKIRRLYIESTEFAEAGERVQGRLGSIVEQQDLSVETMLDKIYGPKTTPAATAAGY
jgi:hypothetical protein